MDIRDIILKHLKKKKEIKVSEIVKETGFSRAYISRFFQELKNEGEIVLIGKANKARYVLMGGGTAIEAKKIVLSVRHILQNKNLSEDLVLDEIKQDSGIFLKLPKNISIILDYAFTEMLNNAIEHSRSSKIEVKMKKTKDAVLFDVRDWGVGIFSNIMRKKRLKNEFEAIQDLLKGKQTTKPKQHTGEGIFFTSKVGDTLIIQGSAKKVIFNNLLDDIFIKDSKKIMGTRVVFTVGIKSKNNLNNIFKKYSAGAFSFGRTETKVALYKLDSEFISRSQARRILSGLEKFKKIVLDFKKVDTVGQAFADQVFRVWNEHYPDIEIEHRNANKNIVFMIKRSLAGE